MTQSTPHRECSRRRGESSPSPAGPSGLDTRRDVPGRAPTPPGQGYLARTSTVGFKRPATRGGKQPRRGRGGKQPRRGRGRGGRAGAGGGGGGDDDDDDDGDDESSAVSTPRSRMDQDSLQHQLQMLLNDQQQTARGRRIAGITTTNTITTTYKDGGRPQVTRNSSSVSN